RLILQKARRHRSEDPLRRVVSTWFQVLFHSPPGVLFTFPSRYWFTIGHQRVFRLSGWSRRIHTGFLGPRATWENTREPMPYVYGGFTLSAGPFKSFDFSIGFLLPVGSAAPTECSHYPIQA